MAANSAFFSAHSSNPLELPTSDPTNSRYLTEYHRILQLRNPDGMSSDDPILGYQVVEDYQQHIANIFPEMGTPQVVRMHGAKMKERKLGEVVTLVEDSEDELEVMEEGDDEVFKREVIGAGDVGERMDEEMAECEESDGGDGDGDGEEDGDGSEFDEEQSILLKPEDEQEEIREEITDLEEAVPQLAEDYRIVDRLGTGTFSSVYKAVDLHHDTKWYVPANEDTNNNGSSSSSSRTTRASTSSSNKVFVAIKRIYVTSNPERIRNEIAILDDCRGCRHISQLITAFRHRDQVVVVMPYHRNDDFRDFYKTLPMSGVKAYFRCLFRALRDIHARDIIHRDVKPANFLFDVKTGRGTLCDFGLACRIDTSTYGGNCLHTAPTRAHPHGRIRAIETYDAVTVKMMQREARQRGNGPSDRVGYPDKDTRPYSKANRAGTRGFRAPEVLFKCNEQTGAIDIWSAGMILLFFLTGKFPIFQSNDDIEALMEIATIIGKKRMEHAATLHNRTFATNVPSVTAGGMTWDEFVQRQNPDLFRSPTPDPNSSGAVSDPSNPTTSEDVSNALSLLDELLNHDSTARITARDALYHPFLVEESSLKESSSSEVKLKPKSKSRKRVQDMEDGDDSCVPQRRGEGKCGALHWIEEGTEAHYVKVYVNIEEFILKVPAGKGIAYGDQPCEYHVGMEKAIEEAESSRK